MGNAYTHWFGEEVSKKYVVKQDGDNLWSVANVVDPEIETADSEELITEFTHDIVHDELADFVDISIQVTLISQLSYLRVALIRIKQYFWHVLSFRLRRWINVPRYIYTVYLILAVY